MKKGVLPRFSNLGKLGQMQMYNSKHGQVLVPSVGDKYDHETGIYEVDWVYGCNGKTCLGLCGEAMTWTGTVTELEAAGFKRHNKMIERRDAFKSIVAVFLAACIFLCNTGCSPDTQSNQSTTPSRFRKVDSFIFQHTCRDGRADVYEDTETGVRYLYIWGGSAAGGPAITRLWDE